MSAATKIVGIALAGVLLAWLPAAVSLAMIDGLTGSSSTPVFNLAAGEGRVITGDGNNLPVWGFADLDNPNNPIQGKVQYPGPTLIVNEGDTVTINLTNNLSEPVSLVFPGLDVASSTAPVFARGSKALLSSIAPEAAPGGSQRYVFTASRPGTFYYQSGSNQAVQLRMGLFGAIVVRPTQTTSKSYPVADLNLQDPAAPPSVPTPLANKTFSKFAYNEAGVPATVPVGATTISNLAASTGYDREFLFLLSEMDPNFQTWMDLGRDRSRHPANFGDWIVNNSSQKQDFTTWKANYWFINGRSAPDDMGTSFDPNLPNQPYAGMVAFHPGEMALTRFLNLGRDFHPLHTHGNHQRIVAEDGLLMTSAGNALDQTQTSAVGADLSTEEFTLTMSAGNTFDSLFWWTGKGLGWDGYGHKPGDPLAPYEYIGDHVVASAAPMVPEPVYGKYPTNQYVPPAPNAAADTTLAQALPILFSPDQLVFTFGQWFSGSPYLGSNEPLPPADVSLNLGGVSYYFMWHSHAEREIVNFNTFPGGMLSMAGVIPWSVALPAE
ncbi:MAG TPA: multicopper oxidase domain-containing protein [Geomonas sp.]|nr:multicopper oxidase domain-containing protein [Geomonas sp.]